MIQRTIKLNLVTDIRSFVDASSRCNFDIDLVSGRYVIDAKSIMGIYTMDLSKPIQLNIHTDDNEAAAFLKEIDRILV